jgi:hypothetical protein
MRWSRGSEEGGVKQFRADYSAKVYKVSLPLAA